MSCAGKGYGTNPQSNAYLYSQFYSSFVTNNSTIISTNSSRNCRKFKGFYPSFTPEINTFSVTSSQSGEYSMVFVTGSNFLPNSTAIKFGNYGYLPVTYYSSFNLSFVIPLNATAGNYSVKAVNLYNGNFSRPVNQSYPGNLNFSNSITYTLT
jgi:hypothetical protein